MVSADNLNFDVLEIIFCFLSGNDLPSVALVSRSFLSAVIPRLYGSILYGIRQAKGYDVGYTMSPFAAVMAHPHLAVHIRSIEIRFVPTKKAQVNAVFVRECRETLRLCKNLKRFRCTVPNLLPVFLRELQVGKEGLDTLRVSANLTTDQAKMLVQIGKLRDLSLEFASWNVVDLLPAWTESMSGTLTELTLYMINDIHDSVLGSILSNLPKLLGLHVVGCPKLDHIMVLRHAAKTPLLRSLSLTTTESTRELALPPPPLYHLKHLSFDTRYTMQPSSSPSILAAILKQLKHSSPSLVSFAIKMPERKMVVGDPFITQLLDHHKHSLRRVAFFDCGLSNESIANICKSCIHLERLDIPIPMKDIPRFVKNISFSKTLQIIVDVDNHLDHGIRPSLSNDSVALLITVCPSLRKIITNHRIWTGQIDGVSRNVTVSHERRTSNPPGALWFMPREKNS